VLLIADVILYFTIVCLLIGLILMC